MKDLFEALLKAFSELTPRRFISLLLVLGLCFLGILAYERFTSSFSLGRIQKSAELLARLNDLQSHNLGQQSKEISDKLLAQLQKAVEADPLSLRIVSQPLVVKTEALWKFLFGGGLWFVFALANLRKMARREKDSGNLFLGLVAFGIFCGVVGVFVPTVWWPFFHILVLPLIVVAFFVTFGLVMAGKSKTKTSPTTPPTV